MTQKFIDRDGLKVLWKQASLQDYPNNETLMAVIDAIDETKLDKNKHSWDNLKNRPFGEGATSISKTILDTTMSSEEMSPMEDENGDIQGYYFRRGDYNRYYKSGSTFDIILDDIIYENVPLQEYVTEDPISGEYIAGQMFGDFNFIEYPFWIYIILQEEEISTYVTIIPAYESIIHLNNNNYTSLTILAQEPATGLLDEKYIPDTIARIEAIPTALSQLENDTGYLTEHQDISNKADKATTLAGYNITDAYTKNEVESFHSALEDYVDNQVAALVNAAPETLDTLGELAAAFEENKEVVEALDASITNKQDKISDTLILVDTVTGTQHKIQIQNGQLVSFPVE